MEALAGEERSRRMTDWKISMLKTGMGVKVKGEIKDAL